MIKVFDDFAALCNEAVETIIREGKAAIAARNKYTLVLSGGSTPKNIYRLLAETTCFDTDFWSKTKLWWGDERCVPPDSPDSNYRMTKEALLDHVPIHQEHIFRIHGESDDLERACQIYTKYFPEMPDLNILGIGPDGHTASLFPGKASLDVEGEVYLPAEGALEPRQRITMSRDMLKRSQKTLVLASGESKQEALRQVFMVDGDYHDIPARLVKEADWYVDKAALGDLTPAESVWLCCSPPKEGN